MLFILACVAGVVTCSVKEIQSDADKKRINDAKVRELWPAFVQYRESHCKVVEQFFGLPYQEGKASGRVNGAKWKCDNGITYSLSASVEAEARTCVANTNEHCWVEWAQIPDIK